MEPDPSRPSASVAAQLIAALEGEAELVDRGSFDIDAEVALDKLARFQLADPSAYVLRLVEAGLLLGAQTVRVEISRRALRASFEAPEPVELPLVALERLFSVLVGVGAAEEISEAGSGPRSGPDEPARAALVLLAVAMVTAMRGAPLELHIESVGADRKGHRRVFVGRGRPTTERVEGDPGTRVLLIDPGRDVSSERALLVDRCRHALAEILVDGDCVSRYPILDGALGRAPLHDASDALVGEVGFEASKSPAVLVLAPTGVELERVVLDGLEPGFVAWVRAALPRDLSQGKVRRTAEFDGIVAAARAAHDAILPDCRGAIAKRAAQELEQIRKAKRSGLMTLVLAAIAFGEVVAGDAPVVIGLVVGALALLAALLYFAHAANLASRR